MRASLEVCRIAGGTRQWLKWQNGRLAKSLLREKAIEATGLAQRSITPGSKQDSFHTLSQSSVGNFGKHEKTAGSPSTSVSAGTLVTMKVKGVERRNRSHGCDAECSNSVEKGDLKGMFRDTLEQLWKQEEVVRSS